MSRFTLSEASAAGLGIARGGRFHREVRLTLPTGGLAEAATVAAGTQLDVSFASRDVNARAAGAPEAAGLQAGANGLVLSLPVARQIRAVRLALPVAGDAIAAFRFDGQVVSDDPVAVAVHGAGGAILDVTDRALILRRRNAGSDFALSPAAIAEVTLRHAPSNPTLALRLGTAELPFPTRLGADGLPVFPANGPRGADLAAALGDVLARLPAPLPDTLEIDLILSADQPCAARIGTLNLGLVLQARGLPGKTVLRFPGGRRVEERLVLALPPGAVLLDGTLTLAVAGTPPTGVAAPTASPVPVPGGEAIALVPGLVAATRLDLGAATLASGADCVVAAPDGPVRLRASLRADAGGLPGAVLSQGGEHPTGAARPVTLALGLPPTALPAGAAWLAVEALGGTAMVLLGGPGTTATGDGLGFSLHPAARDRGLAATLRTARTDPADPALGRIEATLAGVRLAALPENGSAVIDLAPALPALSGTTTALLAVSSLVRAVVTLDPPLLRYTLP